MTTPLFDNAVDSLSHGIAFYLVRSESPTAIKHAVLNIYHSIELFLKERVARVHPLLIYRNIDKPISDDSLTIGLVEVLQRLENLSLPVSKDQQTVLLDLQRRRNRIEHYRFDPSVDHALSAGKALKFLLEFLPEHLGTTLEDLVDEEEDYHAVLEAVLAYEERVRHAVSEASAERNPLTSCPECSEDTLALDSARGNYCFLCHQEFDFEECERCSVSWPAAEIDSEGLRPFCHDRVWGPRA